MPKNITSRRRIILDDEEKQFVLIDIVDAKLWERCGKGTRRGEKWAKVVRQAQRFEDRGIDYDLKYYKSKYKRSEFGDGVVEVIAKTKAS